MKINTVPLLSLAVLLALPNFTLGHHGTNISYDHANPITFKDAIVTEFRFANPHVRLFFDVKAESGEIIHWSVEGTSPNNLVRNGWTRQRSEDALKSGTPITITLFPSKAGTTVGLINVIFNQRGEQILLERAQRLPETLSERQ